MKNPWMSLWLSAANTMTSAARGQAAAEMRRTQDAMMRETTRQAMALWFPAAAAAPVKAKTRKRRRR